MEIISSIKASIENGTCNADLLLSEPMTYVRNSVPKSFYVSESSQDVQVFILTQLHIMCLMQNKGIEMFHKKLQKDSPLVELCEHEITQCEIRMQLLAAQYLQTRYDIPDSVDLLLQTSRTLHQDILKILGRLEDVVKKSSVKIEPKSFLAQYVDAMSARAL